MKPEQQSLVVALRVRPMNQAETGARATEVARAVDNHLVVLLDTTHDGPENILRANRSKERTYAYDVAFGPGATQMEVYEQTIRSLVDSVAAGYHATAFAYGPTGAGKTYTMLGTESEPGMIVLMLNDLFHRIEEKKEDTLFRTSIAYLEVYNEMIRDLLHPSSGCLELREDGSGEAVVTGLVEVETKSAAEVLHLVRLGSQRRTCEPTAVNKTSSRSHAILKLTLEQRSTVMDVQQEVKTGILYMVDLAGSERAAVTKNRGKRMIEGAHINRSLLALGNCINTLGGVNYKGQFVNYRDSKLTRLLKDSLAGSHRTTMIAHISPASTSIEESRNTLNYAERAKHIKVKPHQTIVNVSYHITQYHKIIAELRGKIERLQEQLQTAKTEESHQGAEPTGESLTQLQAILTKEKALLTEEKDLQQEILAVQCALLQNALECQKHICTVKEWEMKRSSTESLHKTYSNSMMSPTASSDHTTSRDQIASSCDDHVILSELCTSPDSVAELLGVPLEPMEVSSSREQLASLAADKRRLEVRQRRLQQKLKTNKSTIVDLQQQLTGQNTMDPFHREMLEVIVRARELEGVSAEHIASALVAGVQLSQGKMVMEELTRQNTLLLSFIEQQRSLMGENKVPIPPDIEAQYFDLCKKHKSLAAQMAIEKGLSPIKGVELPNLAHMSAHLPTATPGSKSNLLLDEGATDSRQHSPLLALSDIKLPTILDASITNESAHLMGTLPSLVPLATSSLTSPHQLTTISDLTTITPCTPVKETLPNTPLINHQNTAEVSPTETLVEATLLSAKKTGLLSKVTSFTPPYISISRCSSNKYKVKGKETDGERADFPHLSRMTKKKAKKEGRTRAATFPPPPPPPSLPPAHRPHRTTLTLNELAHLHSNKLNTSRKTAASPISGKLRKKPPPKITKSLHKVNVEAFIDGSPYTSKQSHKKLLHPST